jgi:hypothetical protein
LFGTASHRDGTGAVIYGVRHVPVYASVGHSIMSDDGPHTFFLVGIKLTSD